HLSRYHLRLRGLERWRQRERISPFASIPGPLSAVLRFGNLPAMINADVHSGEDVILIAVGPGSDCVRGQMDNTEVFRVMAEALGLGLSDWHARCWRRKLRSSNPSWSTLGAHPPDPARSGFART